MEYGKKEKTTAIVLIAVSVILIGCLIWRTITLVGLIRKTDAKIEELEKEIEMLKEMNEETDRI